MARMTEQAAQAAVVNALPTGGGEVTHNDLIATLDSAGNGEAAMHLRNLKKAGVIVARVVHVDGGKPELRYSLPSDVGGGA